jgi:integrase
MRCLDREGIAALLDAADDPAMRTLLALSVSAGLRQGEALGLRWADLDLGASRLRVRWQLGRDGKLVEPKTEQAKREVDLGPSLVAMLRAHKLRSLRSQPGDYVFASADGSPFHYLRVSRTLRTVSNSAGLNTDGVAKFRWHDLRHSAASALISAGLNVVYVSRQLGHANPSITLNTYAHLFARAEHAERARSAMDAALAGSERVTPGGKQGENETAEQGGRVAQLREIGVGGN